MKPKYLMWPCMVAIILFLSNTVSADARWDVRTLQPVMVGDQTALPIEIYYVYRQGNQGTITPMTNGSLLRDGDRYGIVFRPQQRCFVYIFQVEADDYVTQLFPQNERRNPVQGGITYYLPAEDMPLTVGVSSPMRQIYFLASPVQEIRLEETYQEYLQKQSGTNPLRGEIARRQFVSLIRASSLSSIAPIVNLDRETVLSLDTPEMAEEIRRVFSMNLQKQLEPHDIMANLPRDGLKGVQHNDLLDEMPVVRFFDLFHAQSATIFQESYPALYEYGEALQAAANESVVVIAAHADEMTDEQGAIELSRQRANAVKRFFLTHFQIDEDRLLVKPYGNQKPFAASDQAEARKLNNRIELIRIR